MNFIYFHGFVNLRARATAAGSFWSKAAPELSQSRDFRRIVQELNRQDAKSAKVFWWLGDPFGSA
jgi:hypothetical protein